jgi:transcriptional regulator with XRE-family HTH domain
MPGQGSQTGSPSFRARLLGCELRRIRGNRGLTLTELARKARLSTSFLSEIEQGKKSPSLASLDAIASVLGVPRDALVPPMGASLEAKGLPERIRSARERAGMTQEGLAEAAGVSTGLIGQIEAGSTRPSLATIEHLSVALGVTPCHLLVDDPEVERILAVLGAPVRRLIADPDGQLLLETAGKLDRDALGRLLEYARKMARQ